MRRRDREARDRTVSERLRRGPCSKFLPEPDASCRLILSKLFSASWALCFTSQLATQWSKPPIWHTYTPTHKTEKEKGTDRRSTIGGHGRSEFTRISNLGNYENLGKAWKSLGFCLWYFLPKMAVLSFSFMKTQKVAVRFVSWTCRWAIFYFNFIFLYYYYFFAVNSLLLLLLLQH